jgi:phosphoglucosamine mutase
VRPEQQLFGTDGVRGVANQALTPELALRLGRAAGYVLAHTAEAPRVVIGRDTRISGHMLSMALASGLMSVGLDVVDLGVMPTPGIAWATRSQGAAAGAVVSASHNPFADNGIKFFGPDGIKLSDEREAEIARHVARAGSDDGRCGDPGAPDGLPRPTGRGVGAYAVDASGAGEGYLRHVCSTALARFDGVRVVLDCANGATSGMARQAFERLGASVGLIAAGPDGGNINDGCGSTHPETLRAAVLAEGADIGFAFDGDGDRVVAIDGRGQVVDGDGILAVAGLDMLRRGELPGRTIVATVMSNLGLDAAMRSAGGRVVRTPVGDRYVYGAMRDGGYSLGGEQAGHIIFLAHNTTGDGLITAVQLLDTLVRQGQSLAEATAGLSWYPQVQSSVRFADPAAPRDVVGLPATIEARKRVESALGENGRVVLRASGTEPVVRIMVEALDEGLARRMAKELEEVVRTGAKTQ